MKMRTTGVCFMLLFLASCANSYPLHGGNDVYNVTVFGTILQKATTEEQYLFVDIGASGKGSGLGKISLVDEEDKFYDTDPRGYGVGGTGRSFVVFKVPENVAIKRLRFEPENGVGGPFSIDWEGVPEIGDSNVNIKFYGLKRASGGLSNGLQNVELHFDLKFINNGSDNLKIHLKDFAVIDQFGWKYQGPMFNRDEQVVELLPGEAMRSTITFWDISSLSRPVFLNYKNLSMDISAWT